MKMTTLVGMLLVATSTGLGAQAAASGPRAGAWAGEVNFDGGTPDIGGAILRFRNDRSAWLFGLAAAVERNEPDNEPGDPFPDEDQTLIGINGRFGLRSYRSPGSSVRPIVGGGITARTNQITGIQRYWDAGVYGEFGIARFFGENFSISAGSDISLRRAQSRNIIGDRSVETRLGLDGVRLSATVIF
jgi:hypothetical protein